MKIKSNIKEYELIIKENFEFVKEFYQTDHTFYVIDRKVFQLYEAKLFFFLNRENVYLIDALESEKTIETALCICERMMQLSGKRNIHLISFGGGIIQDITGFVANILYRGIKWDFIPTTLLAACDSCIGGKTSLNYKQYKNLLGTFYPPDRIFICSEFFYTLSEQDYQSGLGEVIKFNIMSGNEGLLKIEKSIDFLLRKERTILDEFVIHSLFYKKKFIEKDEFDKGIRVYLNFAHTFGHAFETISHYKIPHGTAVALGMLAANHVSLQRGYIDEILVKRIEDVLLKIIHIDLSKIDWNVNNFLDAMHRDKKQTEKYLTVILMCDEMKLKICKDVQSVEIEEAINYVTGFHIDKGFSERI